ncbi:unnamed protein product [Nesidiocoris tenuis]|uniref:Uncharacterized protein n=1 Tax=Nesidiocoris tenuis TaxID=355587 RepID=A0A6H5H614_9HEMI|nr:unnamed protein product [Nesidiocoris tenuis]
MIRLSIRVIRLAERVGAALRYIPMISFEGKEQDRGSVKISEASSLASATAEFADRSGERFLPFSKMVLSLQQDYPCSQRLALALDLPPAQESPAVTSAPTSRIFTSSSNNSDAICTDNPPHGASMERPAPSYANKLKRNLKTAVSSNVAPSPRTTTPVGPHQRKKPAVLNWAK